MRLGKGYLAILLASVTLALAVSACAPAASPTPAPAAATPSKQAEATKPAVATATTARTAAPTPKPATLKFGTIASTGYAGVYLAADRGYFKEQGLDVELTFFHTVQELIAPLGTGQLDVIALPPSVPLLAAADRGVDLKVVSAASRDMPGFEANWVMLRKDLADSGQVKTPADLKGMTVAMVSQGSISDMGIQRLLEQGGLKPGDVETVVLTSPDQTAAFANKAIAAGWNFEPQVTQDVQQGLATKWVPAYSLFGGKLEAGDIVYGSSLLKNRDLGQRWMVAYLKGVRDYMKARTTKQGWGDVVKSFIKYTGIKDTKLYDAMETPYIDPNGVPDKESIDLQYNWWVKNGLYQGNKKFDDITDLSYAGYAVQKLGKQ